MFLSAESKCACKPILNVFLNVESRAGSAKSDRAVYVLAIPSLRQYLRFIVGDRRDPLS